MRPVYVIDAVRTPVGRARGALSTVRPDDLLSHCIEGLFFRQPRVDKQAIGDVIVGCAMPEGSQGMNVARIGTLLGGLPDVVPAMTINRFCASGLQAIALAAQSIASGQADVMVAAGVESMSQVPMGGVSYSPNPRLFEEDEHLAIAYGMGITAERVAEKWSVSRTQQDAFAVQSHEKALKAIKEGEFESEIRPFNVVRRHADLVTGALQVAEHLITQDEGPRVSNEATLGRLRTVFKQDGSVTAGNTSQMSDGAGALLLASEEALSDYDCQPLAEFKGFAVAGVAPEIMGIGPVEAIPKCLAQTGLTLDDMDWIELNEAFAAQALAVMHTLKLDPSKVNPLGGAIALGHPLGATGAIRATTLCHALRRHQLKYGMVTMCVGTGMGACGIFESI